jgi:ComF family protein
MAPEAPAARRWSITNDCAHCQPRGYTVIRHLIRLFVESCPACGDASPGGFCGVCAAGLVRVADPCPSCGLERPVAGCPRQQIGWQVDAVVAPFSYQPPLDHYVHAFKYRGARALGRAFALLLAPAALKIRGGVDAVVAVPLHRARLRERGYNQAQEIARALAPALGVPALEHGIARRTRTAAQTGKGAGRRRAGVAHAFQVTRDLTSGSVVIVDDVVTTGATVNALAEALRAAGAQRCVVLALARTPEPAQARNV